MVRYDSVAEVEGGRTASSMSNSQTQTDCLRENER